MKFCLLYLLVVLYCKNSLQWIELNRFECYEFSRQNMSTLLEAVYIPKQNCYKAATSKYFMGCLTVINDGYISGGCYETIEWEYRFLCMNSEQRVTVYNENSDTLGLNMYDRPFAFCCKGTLCNSIQLVSDLVVLDNKESEKKKTMKFDHALYVTTIMLFSIVGTFLGLAAKWKEGKNREKLNRRMDNVAEKENWTPIPGKQRKK